MPRSLAPSRDDTWGSLPIPDTAETIPGAGTSSTKTGSRPNWIRTLLTLGVIASAFLFRVLGPDSHRESRSVQLPAVVAKAGPGVVLYLSQVEAICQAHDAAIAAHPGNVPLTKVVRSENRVTSQIAAVPAPPAATEMRRTLLKARRGVDQIATKTYRLAVKSPDPQRTVSQLRPLVIKRVDGMYGTFASFGVYCNIAHGHSS